MRYIVCPTGPEASLAFGIGEAAAARRAVAFGGLAQRVRACQFGAAMRAVDIPPVAATADDHLAVAAGALVESGTDLHRQKKADEIWI